MDIVIIGSGNTATVLGKKLKNAGHRIIQVFGRNASAASELAYTLGTESTNYWSTINLHADIYIIAVSDAAIAQVTARLRVPGKIVVHTAGGVSKDVLKPCSVHYGVFYPLQSLNKHNPDLRSIPMHVDASDQQTLQVLKTMAAGFSNQVQVSDDNQRAKLHVAAVFCNNFPNHLYSLAENFCKSEGLDFDLLKPLILETAVKVQAASPAAVQTGPAIRNDEPTIERHMAALDAYPAILKVYQCITESIRNSLT